MTERRFNLFNCQPFYILVVLLIFSAYIHRNEKNHQIGGYNKMITASLTNEIESPGDQNTGHHDARHSQFSDINPFANFPGKESIKDIRLNNFELISFNQTDKNIIKTLFRYPEIHESKVFWFLYHPLIYPFTEIAVFLVLRV